MDKELTKFQKMIVYFLIYSFLGWICEELFCITSTHEFVNRGFLFGPLCPIYGFGAVIILIFFNDYRDKPIRLFFLSAIVLSTFEYVTDFFLQALFSFRWWDYTNRTMNLNGRIALSFSIVWGLGTLFFIKVLHPFITKNTNKLFAKIPFKLQHIVLAILVSLMSFDTIVSSIFYLHIF